MHRTWGSSFMTLPQPIQRRPSTATTSGTQQSEPTLGPTTLQKLYVSRRTDSNRTLSYPYFFTRSGRTTSTVWGPGALTGKLLKQVGEKAMGVAENLAISLKLNQMEKMQPYLLGSVRELSHHELVELVDQCRKLVELCIIGMRYRQVFMTKALGIVLNGFKQPGRHVWTYNIAEAISNRRNIEIFEIFRDCFFSLLDESVFRIDGVVDLETLSFRCPAVAHEIATIISYLARKDQETHSSRPQLEGSSEVTFVQEDPSNNVDENASTKASFSNVIIQAGFFRLINHSVEHGLPHWDVRGKECLEVALQDVANAQIYCGDLQKHSEEAMRLIWKLRGRRLLMDDIVNRTETTVLELGIEEA